MAGFNEDPDTGLVYTGIPGYGLCESSADLKSWRRLGTDDRLKSNIHGLVVFKHEGETLIAAAQNEAQRVLIVGLDGRVRQELTQPKGGEFDFAEANGYYSNTPTLEAMSARGREVFEKYLDIDCHPAGVAAAMLWIHSD